MSMNSILRGLIAAVTVAGASGCFTRSRAEAASELYGNYETLGVIAECPVGHDPGEIGQVKVYLLNGDEKQRVQDAVRCADFNYFVSSIFFLKPGHEYRVLVEFYDKAGEKITEEQLKGETRPEPVVPAPAATLAVSPTKNSLQAALEQAGPGTAVILKGGTYYTGDLVLPHGGTPGSPVVIRAAPGEKVVIDGSSPEMLEGGWEPAGEGLFRHKFNRRTWNVSLEEKSTGKIIRCCPMPSLSDLQRRRSAGMTFKEMNIDAAYFCDGHNITLMPPQSDIKRYRVHVSVHTQGLVITGKENIVIDGITFRFFGAGDYGSGILIQGSSDILVQRCRFEYVNSGVWVKGGLRRVTVQDNFFIDDLGKWHFSYIKTRGARYHGQIETGCVLMDGHYSGRGLVVRYNYIKGLFDGAHLGAESNAAETVAQNPRTQETDFYGNIIDHATDDLIEADGHARNLRIFQNKMEGCLSGISIAQALDGPTWIIYNTICKFGDSVGAKLEPFEGYPVKTNGGLNPDTGSGPVFFYHNTSWTFTPRESAFLIKQAKWRKLVFRNNIWFGQSGGLIFWRKNISPIDMHNDVVYTKGGPQVKIAGNASGPGDKSNGVVLDFITVDPKLVDPAAGDYRLSAASPCINRGVLIPGINNGRFKGSAPDIGWHESGTELPHFGPRYGSVSTGGIGSEASSGGIVQSGTPAAKIPPPDPARAAELRAELQRSIASALEDGGGRTVSLPLFGRMMEVEIDSAEDDILEALVDGDPVVLEWKELDDGVFAGVLEAVFPDPEPETMKKIAEFYARAGLSEKFYATLQKAGKLSGKHLEAIRSLTGEAKQSGGEE